jgi:membrane protease YdiL (CAAX protease family)
MINQQDKRRIIIYLSFTFGIAWATALVIYITGGLKNSPAYNIGGLQLSLAFILLATIYMFSPAIANLLTRLTTKEGKANLSLQPKLKQGRWLFFLATWLLPGILTIAGTVLYFMLFPGFFDPNLSLLMEQLSVVEGIESINPWVIVVLQTSQAILIAPILNAISTFGEEFGWRGYLQPKLLPLGSRKAILLTGVIWGVWHWPMILMGYNYGTEYFGAPFLGPLAMVWFTITLSVIFGWATIKAGSVWPGVIGHGAINGIASIGLLFVQGTPDPLLGPAPVGLIGGLGLTAAAVLLFILPNALKPRPKVEPAPDAQD